MTRELGTIQNEMSIFYTTIEFIGTNPVGSGDCPSAAHPRSFATPSQIVRAIRRSGENAGITSVIQSSPRHETRVFPARLPGTTPRATSFLKAEAGV